MSDREIREREVEAYLVKQVEERLHGMALKFSSPNRRNVPDRLLLIPDGGRLRGPVGYVGYKELVECKAPGEKPRPAQEREFKRYERLGIPVYVVDSIESVDTLIEFFKRRYQSPWFEIGDIP